MTSATPPKKKPGLRAQNSKAQAQASAIENIEAELTQIKSEIIAAESTGDHVAVERLRLQLQQVQALLDQFNLGSAFSPALPVVGSKQVLLNSQPLVELDYEALVQEQLLWIRSSGPTPVEFLARVYRNPLNKMNDRVSAARALLDYTHRKLAVIDDPVHKDPIPDNYQQALKEKLLARLKSESGPGDQAADPQPAS